jgi:hypothetical protein
LNPPGLLGREVAAGVDRPPQPGIEVFSATFS